MFVVSGVSGNTGSVVARTLLAQEKPVTVLVRDPNKGGEWKTKGAQVAVAPLEDAGAVARALAGAEGAYLLVPPNYRSENLLAEQAVVVDALAKAVAQSGVPHVVLLSSVGAQHEQGTGPIVTVHRAERAIGPAARNFTALRASFFLENWAGNVQAVVQQGVLHNFLTPDRKIPMIATADIGRFAAACLLNPAKGRRVLDLAGPADYSPRDIANGFAEQLGKPVRLETHPLAAVEPVLTGTGMPAGMARLFHEMYEGIESGLVAAEGTGELLRGETPASAVIARLLGK